MAEFDHRVHLIRDDQWHAPTPCTEWDVRDLVNHLVYEQLWAPLLLNGATLEEVGDRFDGDQLGEDPITTWEASSGVARDAFARPGALDGIVHTSMGETTALEYTRQMTTDLAVHAWDLARGIGADEALDEDLVEALHEVWARRIDMLASSGVFAPPVGVPQEADTQARLLGVLGRDCR